ncbi:N-acetyltransferase family protein [Sphingomonas sp.]|uniref:GNAT family N-acetyltransferase n=1 Tax=Sphingomonas sp. TaxID=28214 RepID=UPI003D6D795E
MSDLDYRTPTEADGAALSTMARTSFAATFATKIAPPEMSVYLDTAYGPTGHMQRDLGNPAILWRAAFQDGVPVGYVKVMPMSLPYDAAVPGALEVRQLYVDEDVKGAGVAAALMAWAIDTARMHDVGELYLAVFDDNERAVRFYARHGFAKVGRFDFVTGDQVHDDGIWRLAL